MERIFEEADVSDNIDILDDDMQSNFILPDRNEPMDVSNSFPDPEVQDDYQNAPKEKAGIGAAAAVQDTQAAVQDNKLQSKILKSKKLRTICTLSS